jgi:hypothetical protein
MYTRISCVYRYPSGHMVVHHLDSKRVVDLLSRRRVGSSQDVGDAAELVQGLSHLSGAKDPFARQRAELCLEPVTFAGSPVQLLGD